MEELKKKVHGERLEDIEGILDALGQPKFRAKQVTDWLYKKRVKSWDEMTNLPISLRTQLADVYTFSEGSIARIHKASDTTRKLLLRMDDGSLIETVILWAPDEEEESGFGRVTVCLSTQVGCAYGCKFCASGLSGFKRNLESAEIVFQLLMAAYIVEEEGKKGENFPIDNVVIMGMGEPLANYDNLLRAISIINGEWGFRFGARRITVSTSGLIPEIKRLAKEKIQFRLAISLHATSNEVRNQIMPINRKYPIEELLPAVQEFNDSHGRMITLEYILIQGINDSVDEARQLVKIAHQLHAHINLIPYNEVENLPWKRPSLVSQNEFFNILKTARVSVTIRREKGDEIAAACGQLRLKTEFIL